MASLRKQSGAKCAQLLQSSAKHVELGDDSSHVDSQCAAEATMSDDLEWIAGTCERPAKRPKVTRQFKDSSTTPSTAAFLALFAERAALKNCFETSTLENQCISE